MHYIVQKTIGIGNDTLEPGERVSRADFEEKGIDVGRLVDLGCLMSEGELAASVGIEAGANLSDELMAELEDLRMKVAQMPSENVKLTDKQRKVVEAAQARVTELEAELDKAKGALEPFQKRNDELANEVGTLKAKVTDLEADLEELTKPN